MLRKNRDEDQHSEGEVQMISGSAATYSQPWWHGVGNGEMTAFGETKGFMKLGDQLETTSDGVADNTDSSPQSDLEDCSKVEKSTESPSQLTPSASDVEGLLTKICDTTSIAEVELNVMVLAWWISITCTKDLTGVSTSSPPPVSAPIVNATVEATE